MNIRQVETLRYLLSIGDYTTASGLSTRYGISTKTIYMDISAINDELSSFGIEIEKRPRRGIRLIVGPKKMELIAHYIEESRSTQLEEVTQFQRECDFLKKVILYSEKVDIAEWSMAHFVSEASIRRDIEKLEKKILSYHLRFVKKNGEIFLQYRNEEDVRKFLRNYLIQHFDLENETSRSSCLSQFFVDELVENIDRYISDSEANYQFMINDSYRVYLMLDLLISSYRYKSGHHVVPEEPKSLIKNLSQYEVYIIAGDLLSKTTEIPIQMLDVSEIHNICLTMLSVGYEARPQSHMAVSETVRQFIDEVSRLSGVDFTKDEHLLRTLENHIQPMIFRLRSDINIRNQITEEIKSKYSALYNIVWLASRVISKQYAIKLIDSEIAFLTIYFEIAVEKISKPLNIYVIYPHGLATSELIINSVRKLVSGFDRLISLDWRKLNKSAIENADLIISSVELENFANPYILVSPVVTDAEREKIQRAYNKLTEKNRASLTSYLSVQNREEISKKIILDLLKDNILIKQSCRTVEGSIKKMINLAFPDKKMARTIFKSVLSREKLGSTGVYTGVALPHADPNVVRNSGLITMTLDKPIKWGQNLVSVIILIAIAEDDEEVYKNALISLYSRISNAKYIDKLKVSKDKEEFIQGLFE
ncbi:BglG family transcription antiterminator [Streptococcus sobrinus]|uniref:BglG family transcription antiterminator n=2 Tax=Streptococcus sobrinus TaxID=1310 RepID=UPI000303CD72|nr:PTS sugar transporter subunit IIA [Streptococcus sobrinus]